MTTTSERLRLQRQIEKIRKGYNAPFDPREMLGVETELDLYKQRMQELALLLGNTYTENAAKEQLGMSHLLHGDKGNDAYQSFTDQRNKYIEEKKMLEGDNAPEKKVLCDATIFMSSDNMTHADESMALKEISKENDL